MVKKHNDSSLEAVSIDWNGRNTHQGTIGKNTCKGITPCQAVEIFSRETAAQHRGMRR
jgi:hypothetical protein